MPPKLWARTSRPKRWEPARIVHRDQMRAPFGVGDRSLRRRLRRSRPAEHPAACQYSGGLRDKADAFLRFARKPYDAAVRHIRNTDPSEFSRTGYLVCLNRHIREYVTSPGALERLGYREAARRFVETEISANPDLAGPPISELEIDDRGTFTGFPEECVRVVKPTDAMLLVLVFSAIQPWSPTTSSYELIAGESLSRSRS
jgi:hypothetical protein